MGAPSNPPRCLRVRSELTQATPRPPARDDDPSPPLTLTYCVDPTDRICAVNPTWREFAYENGGSEALADHIVGTDLWSSISDPHACEIYRQLTVRARAGRAVRFLYRCDAPTQRRTFEMRIEASLCGGVRFTSELIHAETRPAVRLLDRTLARSDDYIRVCAWCQRVALGSDTWAEVEEAVNRLNLLDTELPPTLTHGMCPACEARFITSTLE